MVVAYKAAGRYSVNTKSAERLVESVTGHNIGTVMSDLRERGEGIKV